MTCSVTGTLVDPTGAALLTHPIGWRGLAGSSAPARAPWCQDHHRRVRHGRRIR